MRGHDRALRLWGVHGDPRGDSKPDAVECGARITPGQVYPLELFQAERHTNASNFKADMNLAFVDCGEVPPDAK